MRMVFSYNTDIHHSGNGQAGKDLVKQYHQVQTVQFPYSYRMNVRHIC